VTNIKGQAFSECTGLTSVTLSSSLDSIASLTFANCTNLKSIIIPNGVTRVGTYAFSACESLTSVVIPNSVTSIETYAFGDCSGLTSIEIPNSVTVIKGGAFFNCAGLTSITIPNGVTAIESFTFAGCTGLTSVNIPNNVTTIKTQAFYGCTALTSIVLPSGVTTVDDAAFALCTALKSITFSENVASIGTGVVMGCDNLTAVISLGRYPPGVKSDTFYGMEDGICLYVPSEYRDTYASVNYWKAFGCIRNYEEYVSAVAASDRVIPQIKPLDGAASIAPVNRLSYEFTAGPNPADRSSGGVSFFWRGNRISNAELYVYDASGTPVKRVDIRENTVGGDNDNRASTSLSHRAVIERSRNVGSWDLTDKKGRSVSEGTYLVKGTVKTLDGKKENVSLIIGVR